MGNHRDTASDKSVIKALPYHDIVDGKWPLKQGLHCGEARRTKETSAMTDCFTCGAVDSKVNGNTVSAIELDILS